MKSDDENTSSRGLVLTERSLVLLAQQILPEQDCDRLTALVEAILLESRSLDVVDLWEPREAALTYWVLMMTGVNQVEEIQIAGDLLVWQAFFAKDSARVLCVQSSEREAFRCCASRFDVHDCPTLIMSDTPDMYSHIKIQPDLLKSLTAQPGELQRFLTRLHALAENGRSLEQLQHLMTAQAFWRGLKVVYKEVKDLVSLKLG